MHLLLGWQVLFHLQLGPSEHEGFQDLVELRDHLDILLLDLLLVLDLLVALVDEPVIE